MQKKAARNISLGKYNSHTDPLFRKYKILKFEDLYQINCGVFMFNLSMGTHPSTISELVTKSANFDRNLEYIVTNLRYAYLKKQAPHSLVLVWNSLNIALRNWLKENHKQRAKNITANPISRGLNYKLNEFRLKGFKSTLQDTLVLRYSSNVNCSNSYCNDCN